MVRSRPRLLRAHAALLFLLQLNTQDKTSSRDYNRGSPVLALTPMCGPGGMGVLHQLGRGPGSCLPNSIEDPSQTHDQQHDPECLAEPQASREGDMIGVRWVCPRHYIRFNKSMTLYKARSFKRLLGTRSQVTG